MHIKSDKNGNMYAAIRFPKYRKDGTIRKFIVSIKNGDTTDKVEKTAFELKKLINDFMFAEIATNNN